MANITDLTEATYPFNGTEYKEVIQSGNSRKALDWNGVETLTGSATMTSGNRLILLNAASGTVTVPTTVPVGQDVEFLKIHASAGTWTGTRSGSETFAGATSFTLIEQYERQVWTKVTSTRWERKLWSLGAQEYETGTWTPAYSPSAGTFGSITYNSGVYGDYLRVGGLCYIEGLILTDDVTVGSASGDLLVSGLPFAAKFAALSVASVSGWTTLRPLELLAEGSNISMQGRSALNDDSGSAFDVANMTTGASAGQNAVRFAGVYKIT